MATTPSSCNVCDRAFRLTVLTRFVLDLLTIDVISRQAHYYVFQNGYLIHLLHEQHGAVPLFLSRTGRPHRPATRVLPRPRAVCARTLRRASATESQYTGTAWAEMGGNRRTHIIFQSPCEFHPKKLHSKLVAENERCSLSSYKTILKTLFSPP